MRRRTAEKKLRQTYESNTRKNKGITTVNRRGISRNGRILLTEDINLYSDLHNLSMAIYIVLHYEFCIIST